MQLSLSLLEWGSPCKSLKVTSRRSSSRSHSFIAVSCGWMLTSDLHAIYFFFFYETILNSGSMAELNRSHKLFNNSLSLHVILLLLLYLWWSLNLLPYSDLCYKHSVNFLFHRLFFFGTIRKGDRARPKHLVRDGGTCTNFYMCFTPPF